LPPLTISTGKPFLSYHLDASFNEHDPAIYLSTISFSSLRSGKLFVPIERGKTSLSRKAQTTDSLRSFVVVVIIVIDRKGVDGVFFSASLWKCSP
jgi:hypothetical protein